VNKNYVLVKPLVTEKSNLIKQENRVAFEVHPDANKAQIKEAIEDIFDVTVLDVNVVRRRPIDRKRQGRVIGRTRGYKKAYVKLSPEDTIEFFEGE